jgi:hypothetical protein
VDITKNFQLNKKDDSILQQSILLKVNKKTSIANISTTSTLATFLWENIANHQDSLFPETACIILK